MSNNTNYKHYHNKKFREPRVNPNEIKASLCLPADLNENIANEIIDTINNTKFNKISIPLSTYRWIIDGVKEGSEPDTRSTTIGYIRNYNAETKEFTLIVFTGFIDKVKSLGDIAIEVQFTEYKERLGTITKLNVIPVIKDTDSEHEYLMEFGE